MNNWPSSPLVLTVGILTFYSPDVGSNPSQVNENPSDKDHALFTNTGSQMQLAISHALLLFYHTFPNIALSKVEIEYSNKYSDFLIKIKGIDVDSKYEIKIDLSEHKLVEQKVSLLPERKQEGIGLAREEMDLTRILSFDAIFEKVTAEIPGSSFYQCELERDGNLLEWEFYFKDNKERIEVEVDAETGHIFDIEYD